MLEQLKMFIVFPELMKLWTVLLIPEIWLLASENGRK